MFMLNYFLFLTQNFRGFRIAGMRCYPPNLMQLILP